jgi:glycine C-acetyltransferase
MDLWKHLEKERADLERAGLYKRERLITSPQGSHIKVQRDRDVLNFCANNYLGLANHPTLVQAAKEALDRYGYGMASVRFICGTLDIHRELEQRLSQFLGTEDTILYSSCFDANGGLFEAVLGEQDAVISDSLNHASIIDGIRLCKAQRFRYTSGDMNELQAQLIAAKSARFRLIATDGVFSMDGTIAKLADICDLAEKHSAYVMVDDSHAVGFMGAHGRGTHEYCDVMGRVHIITGTLGKALGGASGGYTSGPKVLIDWLRQRSRPYLFSNTLAPVITSVSIQVLELIEHGHALRQQLERNSARFRDGMQRAGFTLLGANHPIIPVMIGDAALAVRTAEELLGEGVYVVGFSYPVVPKGMARIRTQMSAAHTQEDIDYAVDAFTRVGKRLQLLS